jgi:hypothetical protein
VVHGDAADAVPVTHLAVQLAHRARAEEARHRVAAERDQYLGLEDPDLAQAVVVACGKLIGQRIAVTWRSTAHDVGDEHVLAAQADHAQHLDQQVAGGAHERATLLVFVEARAFTDEHDVGLRSALARHSVGACLTQPTQLAVADLDVDPVERISHPAGQSTPATMSPECLDRLPAHASST